MESGMKRVTADSRRARFRADRQSPQSRARVGAGRRQMEHFRVGEAFLPMTVTGWRRHGSAGARNMTLA
jgi:hypothetical protein